MSPLAELYVVTHTHWDREWYRTQERFRQRLVRLIDELLDDPPASGESFLLDGQAILLDDYLAVRPERAAELSTLLREGRLVAGPWYVLADNLIPGGEALVRNLQLGRETVRRLRGNPPPVLYCPDSFGHPAVLPELAAGFGCELVILWRGVNAPVDTLRWRGPSGVEVTVYHLPPDGYEFGSSLPTQVDAASERWRRIHDVMAPRANTGVALLLNGADHHARQPRRDDAIAALAGAAGQVNVKPASLREASGAIVAASVRVTPPPMAREQRDSYGYTWTLGGTLGTRAAQKRRNALAERLLVNDVEPWLALLPRGGDGAARAQLRSSWRTLLECHPHDTLCGTSIDAVADAFDARVASAVRQGEGLREDALVALTGHDRVAARDDATRWKPAVVLRNPVARTRSGIVELTLRATVADVAVGPGSASRQGARREVAPWAVAGMSLQVLSEGERVELTESPRAYPGADRIVEARALGWVSAIRGYSVDVIHHAEGDVIAVPNPVRTEALSLDNGLLRVDVTPEGRVSVLDRVLGRRGDDVVRLSRARDAGDLYTPAIREALPSPVVRSARLSHRGPLRGEVVLDCAYGDTSACTIALQLDADARALRVHVTGDNRERDQRLRVELGARTAPPSLTVADAAFWPVRREATASTIPDPMEARVPVAPLHRWVATVAGDAASVIVSDGLAEYEALDDGSVAITLVRSVGELSIADLPERPGHAGWPASTPGAQCIGPFEASFALRVFAVGNALPLDDVERFAEDELLPLFGETLRSNLSAPATFGGLELAGDGLAFSAAYPSREEGWITLRCVNRRDAEVHGEWRVGRVLTEARRAHLDESPLGTCEVEGGTIRFTAAPMELVTILAR